MRWSKFRDNVFSAIACLAFLSAAGDGRSLAAQELNFAQLSAGKAAKAPVRDRQHGTQKFVESWQDLQTKHIVMQQRDYSCGAAALATVLRYGWGEDVDEADTLRALNQLLSHHWIGQLRHPLRLILRHPALLEA